MAILATSGRDWAERTKRLAARVPNLEIFSQALIERTNGGWRITQKGRSVLKFTEPKMRRLSWYRPTRISRSLCQASACHRI